MQGGPSQERMLWSLRRDRVAEVKVTSYVRVLGGSEDLK